MLPSGRHTGGAVYKYLLFTFLINILLSWKDNFPVEGVPKQTNKDEANLIIIL